MDQLAITSLKDFVRNAQIYWLKAPEQFDAAMRRSGMVVEVNIPDGAGNTREYSEAQLEQYAKRKAEREQAQFAKIQQGYSKVGTLYRIAFAEPITIEMRKYGKYPEIVNTLTNLLPTVMNRMELDLQHRYGFGTATSYVDQDGVTVDLTVGDGFQLFYTAHTVKSSASTFRNRLANNPQFSRGGLEAMEKMRIENHINQFGQKIPVMDDILWTTDDPNTVNTARELLRSTASIDSGANSGVVNVYSAKYKHVMLTRVATDNLGGVDSTKAKYWGTAASKESSFYLGVNEEPHVTPPGGSGSNAEDFLTEDWFFKAAGGWMIVIVSAQFVGMSSGDGTP